MLTSAKERAASAQIAAGAPSYPEGPRAVIAQSFERIHRANLVGMGVLPLQFAEGDGAQSLGLTGEELFAIEGVADAAQAVEGGGSQQRLRVRAERTDGARASTSTAAAVQFEALVRIDTPREAEYFRHGGILQYVLRALLSR